ncbi:transcription elongation factor Spt6 [Delitschia confertaspora ATCC 74209]|uniref:Transcription elongation factor Spt6 n=1 Tax=Delitschia confertaspora ATCC 74209 TaxID=1513339 RepID=A0A9P4JN78_9PLEO|nr:transcription elongation factor Spt6 [Delitschia confertaspora ATCC 74209]
MADAFFDMQAELGSEEEDGDFDEEQATEPRLKKTNGTNGNFDDSSEEEEDDDEARLRAEGAGWVVDDDEEDAEEDAERSRRRKKRRRKERERSEEALDEEDLDLIGGLQPREPPQSKYKRLKRGHKGDRSAGEARGIDNIFSDDDEGMDDIDGGRRAPRTGLADEFADFIEEDHFEDELDDDLDVAQPGGAILTGGLKAAGLDEGAEEDYRQAFGDGTDYDWALGLQEAQAEGAAGDEELKLEDVFEPAQLEERMLTDADTNIRMTDVPERLQLARRPFEELDLTPAQMDARLTEESNWIAQLLWPKKRLPSFVADPFKKAIKKVLEFLTVEDYEVPFIFTHRKDYLIYTPGEQPVDEDDPDPPPMDARPMRLLSQNDLWEIFDMDLRFRALVQKRDALQKTYDNIRGIAPEIRDDVIEDLISKAVTIEELQELQDYLHFQYSAEMNDLRTQESEANGTQKRAQTAKIIYDKIRAGKVYDLVRAFGITASDFAQNCELMGISKRTYTEDHPERPEDLADTLIDSSDYKTGAGVLNAAKGMFVQELVMNPRLRRFLRRNFYQKGLVDCIRTSKGMRKITEDHPYYEFKYLRNQDFQTLNDHPEKFLKMLKAEEENLVEVKVKMNGYEGFKQGLYEKIVSDNQSGVADAWNALRREALDAALAKLEVIMTQGVKDNLRNECEKVMMSNARENFYNKLDQAPYKPKGTELGTVSEVLTLSHGAGTRGDAICWTFVNALGRLQENGKFVDFRLGNRDRGIPDGKDIAAFCELVRRRRPDVIGLSGFSVETRKLYKDLQEIIAQNDLRGPEYEDNDLEEQKSDLLDVVLVNDEVARKYWLSDRAKEEFPRLPDLARYCVALARYLQNPLLEYASLGRDVITLPLVQNQELLNQDKLLDRLDTAMVDMVNLVGVEINDAYSDPYLAKILPFVCGLGPRKANSLLTTIKLNHGEVLLRSDLLGITGDNDPRSKELKQAVGPKVFQNCASFLYIRYDEDEEYMDYLDNTRIHPEDYDLARKMVADALEMDEEDIQGETAEGGPSAVVRRMIKEDANDRVHDLILEEYATEIEKQMGNRKRATLETIRAELVSAYEEIRQPFAMMTPEEIFTMLTGETKESLVEYMIVPVKIRRTFPDHVDVVLSNGLEGTASAPEFPEEIVKGGIEPRSFFQVNHTFPAKIMHISRKQLTVQVSFRAEALRQPYRKDVDKKEGAWDIAQEAEDKQAEQRQKEKVTGRPHRVVNHPLFFPFNATQAEEYLGTKEPGEVVIRPSSKGLDHLAVTWKVADNSYQHIDVLELGKENEYSVGKTLKVGRNSYSDLDELIVNHVQAMAKKVTEMMKDERFQKGSKETTDQWLKTYTEANPKRFMYAFCIMPKFPGYFWLCYRAGQQAPPGAWPVKVIPNAFELKGHAYPDMKALKNGFKLLFGSQNALAVPPARPAALPVRR